MLVHVVGLFNVAYIYTLHKQEVRIRMYVITVSYVLHKISSIKVHVSSIYVEHMQYKYVIKKR